MSSENRPMPKTAPRPSPSSTSQTGSRAKNKSSNTPDDLARIFNSALVATQTGVKRDFSSELSELTESASFKAVLNAVRQLACVQGIPERQAAEEIIRTFKKLDEIWSNYISREGLDRLRSPK